MEPLDGRNSRRRPSGPTEHQGETLVEAQAYAETSSSQVLSSLDLQLLVEVHSMIGLEELDPQLQHSADWQHANVVSVVLFFGLQNTKQNQNFQNRPSSCQKCAEPC